MERKDEYMTARDEELVKHFFEEHQVDIADDGFTSRVMNQLPERTQWLNRIWTVICLTFGIVLAVVTRAWQSIIGTLQGLLADTLTNNFFSGTPISTMYLTVVAVAAIVCFGILSKERELAI